MDDNFGIFDWQLFQRDVRRDIRNCVLFLFFFYAVNFGVQFALQRIAPMGIALIASIVAGGCVFLIYRRRRFFTDLALPAAERMTPSIFFILLLATQGIQYVFGLLVTLVDRLLPDGLSLTESYGSAMDGLITPTGLLYIILIGPVFEELIFRGAVMGALRRFGDNFAILFSAMLFGFYHMLILQIPFAFVLGLLLGYVAARWSLRFSILLHIAVNGLSMLFSDTEIAVIGIVGGLFMMGSAVVTLILAIANRRQLRARLKATAAYYPHTYASGFSSIAFWVFAAVMTVAGLIQMGVIPIPFSDPF